MLGSLKHFFGHATRHDAHACLPRSEARAGAGVAPKHALRYKAALSRSTAMKDGIHPDYHEITVVMTDGTSYKTRSTYGKAGDTLRLEIDSKSHPAWTGGQQRLLDSGGQLARFNKRFQGFGLKK
jgi:large subunit ribosomal protein L31